MFSYDHEYLKYFWPKRFWSLLFENNHILRLHHRRLISICSKYTKLNVCGTLHRNKRRSRVLFYIIALNFARKLKNKNKLFSFICRSVERESVLDYRHIPFVLLLQYSYLLDTPFAQKHFKNKKIVCIRNQITHGTPRFLHQMDQRNQLS